MSTTDLAAFRALEAASAEHAARVQACLHRYANGEDGEAIDAEYDALFDEGEAIAERLVACEAELATARLRAA